MKKSFKLGLVAASLFSGSLWAAPMPVVTSFSILGDVTKQLGGERIAVTSLVGADQDAHAYQLTGRDVQKIKGAKLVVLNGLGLEKSELLRSVKQNKTAYVEAASGIKAMRGEEHDHDDHDHEGHDHHHHGEFDPHVWHDPVLMQKYAANITIALVKADPAGNVYYQKRFGEFSQKLIDLDSYARAQFEPIAKAKRKVLTGHDAFAYLGKRYDVKFIAPQGVSTESEPSAKQVADIIRQIKNEGIKAVFAENIKDSRLVERIAKETGAKVGGKLYSDALSNGAPAQTYADLFRYNVRVLGAAMK